MAIRFGDAVTGFANGRKARRDEQNDSINNSVKALEMQKLEAEVQRMGRPAFGGGGMPSNVKIKEYDEWGQPKSYEPADKLSSAQELAKDKATKEIFENYETDNARRATLDSALEGSETLPQGWSGKARLGIAKRFPSAKPLLGVNDQQIKDAQEMKMALTQGTLAETAYTKGAISDQEMALFKEASANDDFNSPAIQPVLKKIRLFVDAGQAGRFGAYKKNYGEDPQTWFGQGAQPAKFATPPAASGNAQPIFASNGNQRIKSLDGGATWQPA